MNSKWELYDELIKGIPDELTVDEYVTSGHFAYLRSGERCGLAHNTKGTSRPSLLNGDPKGMPLKEIAALSKSWNMQDATMGIAAINAFYNDRNRLKTQGVVINDASDVPLKERKAKNPTDGDLEYLRGKKVGLIGHFRNIEHKLGGIASLYILERNPSDGDYPDSACEYLLPEMDYVFATGMTMINKTALRLFELKGEHTHFTLMGPSSTLSPLLFSYGVDSIAGFVVTDPDHVRSVIAKDIGGLFAGGMMVDLTRDDFKADN